MIFSKEDLDSIEKLYKNRGYLHVKITNKDNIIQYTPGERYASIVIQMDEGSKAFISKIIVQGLKQVREQMVRNLLKFKPGDVLTPLKKRTVSSVSWGNRIICRYKSK